MIARVNLKADIAESFNDSRIESVEQLYPAAVPVYAFYSADEEGHPSAASWRKRIHLWAKVRFSQGGTALIGLTLENLNSGGHAELNSSGEYFREYVEDVAG